MLTENERHVVAAGVLASLADMEANVVAQVARGAESDDEDFRLIVDMFVVGDSERAALGLVGLAWALALDATHLALPVAGFFDGKGDFVPVGRVEFRVHGHWLAP